MPPLRPSSCLRAARAVQRTTTTTTATAVAPTTTTTMAATRTFSSTARVNGGGGAQYDPPTGWLFGVKPGEKYEKEGWENLFFYGFYGSLGVFAVAYAFKPDTSIQTWALEEARRRLEAEGILEDPNPETK
ncbi:ESSS subunit of NADH:ubiquinone oxidoreductase-domain-containing protein [Lasiosphaeria hispida]|uniref:NADH dehydrogenase [ubiquinone] 1 beta subcomplex subunit 11, mitochondrial n=1 Tax=Lasiosphaeria hispida TaxID=260671 RepID=A0AAJ0HFM8_9PEZI|nr:ESSS subunit of NADH:ubiquinone oxidoreductase-domain-containing protein [Lasiosphaeria hispida]